MPSTDQGHSLTKRQLLAACGSSVGAGALGGYAYGSGLLLEDDCSPTPMDNSATDWPLPHYDGSNTRTVPPENAPESGLSEQWSAAIQTPAQPIIINDSVFVVSSVVSGKTVRAYDLATGQEQWMKHIDFTGQQLPLTAGGNSLFLGHDRDDGDAVSKALATADGSERWTSDVASTQVTAVLDEGLLIFEDSNDIIAVDAHRGEQCWQKSVHPRLSVSAIHARETIILDTITDGKIVALDATTGEQQWEADISDYFHPDEDVLNDGIGGHVIAGTDRIYFSTIGGMLIALDAATGETDWVTPETPPEIPTEGERQYSPPGFEPAALANDSLLVIESDGTNKSEQVYAIDPATGDEQLLFEPEPEEDAHIGSVAVAGDTLFLPVMDELRLVDRTSGEPLETHSLNDHAQSVTLANGYCLITTTKGLVGFQEESDR